MAVYRDDFLGFIQNAQAHLQHVPSGELLTHRKKWFIKTQLLYLREPSSAHGILVSPQQEWISGKDKPQGLSSITTT